MTWYYLSILFISLIIIMNVYFWIAERFQLIDVPNHRSSHSKVTIRGGGIIIPIGILGYTFINGMEYPYMFIGLILIVVLSFIDDLKHLPPMVRISGQVGAMGLLFYQITGSQTLSPVVVLLYIVAVGVLNAYNFMDGINGILAAYSIVLLGTLLFVELSIIHFGDGGLILSALAGVMVFSLYNFRKNARCFAGDAGSVSMAFLAVFFIGLLIKSTGSFIWILLLAVYGVDSVLTIVHRIVKRENIFKAHRSHLYQYYANIDKRSHLMVSASYAFVQLLINFLLIQNYELELMNEWLLGLVILALLAAFYINKKRVFEFKIDSMESEGKSVSAEKSITSVVN